jgi:hypothetical protein
MSKEALAQPDCCGEPDQCWEPCGKLGKSEEHVGVAQPQRKPLTKQERRFIHAATGSMRFFEAVEHAISQTEAAHGIKE